MPETFPKSHLAQFNLKYLQVKSNLVLSSKTDNTITITTLTPPPFFSKEKSHNVGISSGRKEDEGEEIQKLKVHNLR